MNNPLASNGIAGFVAGPNPSQVLSSLCGTSDGKSLWAVGADGVILHSSDGEHWEPQDSPTKSGLNSIFCESDGKSLWAVGFNGVILHSPDGEHWDAQSSPAIGLGSVFGSADGKSLWAVGERGAILHTRDGEHWAVQNSPSEADLYSVFATADGKSLWVVGNGDVLLHSPDGDHWETAKNPISSNFYSVYGTADGKSVEAVGDGGAILRSGDGQHWDVPTSPTKSNLAAVFATSDGKSIWAVGSGGTILHSADGEHWDAPASPTKSDLSSVFATHDGKSVWAVGKSGIVAGTVTSDPEPFVSQATVASDALKLTLTCPDTSQGQGSIDVAAVTDDMLQKHATPRPIATLQISPSCKVSDFPFDSQSLGLKSGSNVHFQVLVHGADLTESYTVDGVYNPWLLWQLWTAGLSALAALASVVLRRVLGFGTAVKLTKPTVTVVTKAPTGSFAQAPPPPQTPLASPDYRKAEVTRVLRQRDEEAVFLRNLNSTFVLRSFTLNDARFFEDCTYEFAPRVNVLLGKNGYGKTLLFRALAALIQNDLENTAYLFPPATEETLAASESPEAATLSLRVDRNGESCDTIRDPAYFRETIGKIPLLAIPDSRFMNRKAVIAPSSNAAAELCRTAARSFILQEPFEGMVIDLLCKLGQESDRSRSLKGPIFRLIGDVIRQLTDDDKFLFHSIKPIPGTVAYEILVTTAGNEGYPVPIQSASQGTLSVLVMFGLIYSFLKSLRPALKDDAVSQVSAIVMIDEIDAHLHPSWQQKIMPLLTRSFPNVQFIVSAHSPLLVAGCDRNEVSVLRRNPNSDKFYLEVLQQDFLGASVQDLYQLVFEVGEMDHLYLEYSAKAAAGEQEKVAKQIERIENTPEPSPRQENELGALLRERRLLKKAADIRETRLGAVETEARIAMLQSEVQKLKEELLQRSGEGNVE